MTIREKAEYVDRETKKETFDSEQVYRYITSIVKVIGTKKKFLNSKEHANSIVLDASTDIYMRLVDKTMPRVDNCLSYINVSLIKFVNNYRRSNYSDVVDIGKYSRPLEIKEAFEELIRGSSKQELENRRRFELRDYLDSIPIMAKRLVESSRYSKNKEVTQNLLISTILTLSSWMTNTARENIILLQNLNKKKEELTIFYDKWNDRFKKMNSELLPVNYNLTPGQYDYLSIITIKLKDKIVKDINEIFFDDIVTEDMIIASSSTYLGDIEDE